MGIMAVLLSAPMLLAGDGPEPLAQPPLENAIRILDTGKKEAISLVTLIERLDAAEVIFLGETHLDETTHRFQWRMYQELLLATEGKVVLSMEMFERDAQPALDDYVAGRIDEPTFLRRAHPWGNYRTDYRPMIELARARSLPVVAANFPASIRRSMRPGGKEGYEKLSDEQKQWIPRELHPNSDAYWQRFARTIRGHGDFFAFLEDPEARLYSTQCLWDNSMGEACVDALAKHPGSKVLHLNGGFHTLYRQGTAAQVTRRRPETKVVVIDIRPTSELSLVGVDPDWAELAEVADYTVYAEDRARAVQDGTHGVTVSTELEYELFVPKGARDDQPVPLLIWMPREGLRAADAMRYLRLAFGDTVAIVAVDPPFPQRGEDLHLGGEWFFEERFDSDMGLLGQGLRRLLSRVARTQPIDAKRIVLAGEEAAATVIASTMLYSRDSMPVQAFAIRPTRYNKLREGGLPKLDPADPAAPASFFDLVVFTDEVNSYFWDEELADYSTTGLRNERRPLGDAPLIQAEVAIRKALGIDPMSEATPSATPLVYRVDSTLGRFWAELEVRALWNEGTQVELMPASAFDGRDDGADGGAAGVDAHWLALPGEYAIDPPRGIEPSAMGTSKILPTAPGPFGGTTIIVTYPATPTEAREAWTRIEAADPISLRSRFSRMRVAHLDTQPTIHEVLAAIREGGGSNVLLVPAAFCATADEMRALRDAVEGHLDGLNVHWLPGLGGRAYYRHATKSNRDKPTETDDPKESDK